MNPHARELIQRKRRSLVPCVYHFYRDPPVIVRGEMQHLFDSSGRRYLDVFAGVSVVQCGHCNPDIVEVTVAQLRKLQHTTTIYLTEPLLDLAEALADAAPGPLAQSFFVNSGSEANEGAVLLAALHTGNHELVALRGGLHGRTKLGMSLTGLGMWRTDPQPVGGISFLQQPHCLRCPLQRETCGLACADQLEDVIEKQTSGRVAALIAEPIQGNGGIVPPPDGYFERLREILRRHGILLIFDEVQTGFGRTGDLFATEGTGVLPDILTVAKGLGNGVPIGAFLTTEAIAASYTRPGASTTGGNLVAAATALAVLRYIHEHRLVERSRRLGAFLRQGLERIAERRDGIAEVRGRGLMQGMELVRGGHLEPDADRCDRVLEALKDRGFLVGKTGAGRNVLTFMPPLVVTEDDLSGLLQALDETLTAEAPS